IAGRSWPVRRSDSHGAVGRRLRLVPDVAWLAHDPPPACEFEHDPVWVLEVERPDEHSRMQLRCDPALAVVVIEYRADLHALGLELGAVLEELLFLDVESDVVHGPDSALPIPQTRHVHRCGDPGSGIRRVE